jgi:nucleotide-binding universal stress UspA family protein
MTIPPLERILIAINMTDDSRRAFYAGLDIATKHGAETFVLHASEPIRSFDFSKKRFVETRATIERVEEGVTARLDDLWAEGGLDAVDRRKVQTVVRGGKAGPEIVATAQAKEVDLVVMGYGSGQTAEYVVRNAGCSVWVVRERTPEA